MLKESRYDILRWLSRLRWFGIAGQLVAIGIARWALDISLPIGLLVAATAVLALFNVRAAARLRSGKSLGIGEVMLNIAVDVGALAWLVAWSGGITNPFASLFLLPIALAAVALPWRWVIATAAVSAAGYGASIAFGRPLPHVHGRFGDLFDLHLWGMAINFAVSGIIIAFALSHLARALAERERELASLREKFARDEGILALATQAAATAHELNTPIASMTLMLDDWQAAGMPAALIAQDAATLRHLVDACRDRVRELVSASADRSPAPLEETVRQAIAHWSLLRPNIELVFSPRIADEAAAIDRGVIHLLTALLNNAADASEQAGSARVEAHVESDGKSLRCAIRDYGGGFEGKHPFLPHASFLSAKPHGLGIGLALSHATVERLRGKLTVEPAPGQGSIVRFDLPLPAPAAP